MHPTRTLLSAGLALVLGLPALSAMVDRNGDGLSDVWAALYHPTKGATVDEDGDGVTNAQEAIAGTDPLNAASRFAAEPRTDTAGNLVLRWHGQWGKRYTVQGSTDLKTWAASPETHVGRGQEISVVVQPAGSAAEARRYWRVIVSDADTDSDGMTNAEEIELGSDPTTADAAKGTPRVYGAEYFVSPTGSDANAGTKLAPFLTLEKAKAAVRAKIAAGVPAGGIAVWLRGGVYERNTTLALGALDSETSAGNSVDWRAWPGEEVRLVGGRRIPASAFSLVTSASPVWNRLDATARGRVLQVDVKPWLGLTAQSTDAEKQAAYGVQQYAEPNQSTPVPTAALELFVDGQPMQLGRWPDAGFSERPQAVTDEVVEVFGKSTPAVAGVYRKIGVTDGVSHFKRDGLVSCTYADGAGGTKTSLEQYYLYRSSWDSAGAHHVSWFLATNETGRPPRTVPNMRPWWNCYRLDGQFGRLLRYDPSGATGELTLDNPVVIHDGFTNVDQPVTDAGETRFTYFGDRPARWGQAGDLWVHGYFKGLFFDQHRRASIDTATKTVTLGASTAGAIVAGRPWYAYNLLEEITQPGEWYLDRATGLLYFWPPAGFGAGTDVVVSRLETPLLQLTEASFVTLRDFTAEATRRNLIDVVDGDSVVLRGLTLRNCGATGATLTGRNHRVSRSRIEHTALAGVSLSGGDRASLTSGGLIVEDCEISDFGRVGYCYQPGVNVLGCGQTVRHNLFYDAHHSAIVWDGNNHRLELNEITDVCRDTNDAGAIYAHQDWGARGTVIAQNHIHGIRSTLGRWVHGIYLDDCLSGVAVERNLVVDVVGNAITVGGGRDNTMVNNLVVRCRRGLYADARGVTWTERYGSDNWEPLLTKLVSLGYQNDIPGTEQDWPTRFPACAAIPNDWAAVLAEVHWLRPEGCVFSRNAGWSNEGWIEGALVSDKKDASGNPLSSIVATDHFAAIGDNLANSDPLFVDEAAGDLRLRADSPVRQIPGWQEIPFDRIGVRE